VFLSLGAVTLFRLFVPLDAAPFLLYLPVVFLISVALGQGPGFLATIVSAVLATTFFIRAGDTLMGLRFNHAVAIVEYLVVGSAMVRVCVALRTVLLENEAALARLQVSETNLRTIVDTVPVGIMFAEAPSGRIVGRNKRLDEIVGAPSQRTKTLDQYGEWQAFHADGRRVEAAEYPLARVIKDGIGEASLQVQYQRRDETRVWIDLVAAATRDAAGRVTGAVVAVSDIDDRKKAEATQRRMNEELSLRKEEADTAKEAAEAANKAKSAFLANMSHELRTPLSAVIGYTELLEEEASEAVMLTDLAKIKANAKHLLRLINDVLDLSKVEANKMEIVTETFDVATFAGDTVATVEPLARVKANTITVELAESLGTMHSDAVKLRQCLFNLLSNACKFTANGQVVLRVHREPGPGGDWLVFAVEDTGIGMTAEQLGRLFQRFSQADETTTRKFGGTGLGLALSRAFSKLLGGDIDVTSALGVGTCFTMRVPATAPELAMDGERQRGTFDDAPHDQTRDLVLVVDDEVSQRDLLTRFLRKQNFEVRTASDGRSGLELARLLKPKVVLLDVMMPGMDGWSVLTALKADDATVDLPVVMVSFVAEPKIGTALGAAATIAKPIDWGRLQAVLTKLRETSGEVLVVDDDRDTRALLRAVLEKNDWIVREACDGADALEAVRHAPPALILLDLTMPVMDGFAFLHRLRELPGCGDIPVVVLSARDISDAEREQLGDAQRVFRKGETSMRDLTAELRSLALGGREPVAVVPSLLE
jgi:PAS domain S-box-containing protein